MQGYEGFYFYFKSKKLIEKELNGIMYRINIIIKIMVCLGEVYVGWNYLGIVKEQRNQIQVVRKGSIWLIYIDRRFRRGYFRQENVAIWLEFGQR